MCRLTRKGIFIIKIRLSRDRRIFINGCPIPGGRSLYWRELTTHWGRVSLICVWSAPSHYLNKYWHIVNWTLRNKLQWNFNLKSDIFIQENAFGIFVCKIEVILSRPQCVKYLYFRRAVSYITRSGARPTKHISIEFEIRWKFRTL